MAYNYGVSIGESSVRPEMISDPQAGLPRGLFFAPTLLCFVLIFAHALAALDSPGFVWGDSYMFARYANNLLAHGSLSWNPNGSPTYGLSSLLFLVIVIPFRLLFPKNASLTVASASLLSGLVFLLLLQRLLKKHVSGPQAYGYLIVFLVLFVISTNVSGLTSHLLSGMDTTFCLAYLTLYIYAGQSALSQYSVKSSVLFGILSGLAFWIRPDLLIYSFLVPACLFFYPVNREQRISAAVVLITAGFVVAALMLVSKLYFGSAVPLSFYAKSTQSYGPTIHLRYEKVPWREFKAFVFAYWFFFLIFAFRVVFARREFFKRTNNFELGLSIGSLVFSLYFLFFVLQIMGQDQRFYYPLLPALAFVAAKGIADFVSSIGSANPRPLVPFLTANSLPIASFLCLAVLLFHLKADPDLLSKIGRFNPAEISEWSSYRRAYRAYWYRLDEFSSLPDGLSIATTEVGHPCAMNLNKQIVDLAGLNELNFAKNGFSAERLFSVYNPDLIYLPHPDYPEMIESILNNSYFRQNYVYFSPSALGRITMIYGDTRVSRPVLMGVAYRKDSVFAPSLQRIINGSGQKQ
jgi:hypothetical protein